jgi:hypothetical protein
MAILNERQNLKRAKWLYRVFLRVKEYLKITVTQGPHQNDKINF